MLPSAAAQFPLVSVLAPVSLRTQSALIGQLAHAWPSTPINNRVAVLNQFVHGKLAAMHKLRKCVTWWRSVASQSHWIKGGTTDEAFTGAVFLWERGASVDEDFDLF